MDLWFVTMHFSFPRNHEKCIPKLLLALTNLRRTIHCEDRTSDLESVLSLHNENVTHLIQAISSLLGPISRCSTEIDDKGSVDTVGTMVTDNAFSI